LPKIDCKYYTDADEKYLGMVPVCNKFGVYNPITCLTCNDRVKRECKEIIVEYPVTRRIRCRR
jgi:hypothetical protein